MSELLANHVAGTWTCGTGPGIPLFDPVLGVELARVCGAGIDLQRAFAFARGTGGPALRALTYEQRAKALSACVGVLKHNRDRYLALSLENSGTTAADSMIDVDGAIFTLNTFAKAGQALGPARFLRDRGPADLSRDGSFKVQHLLVPREGVALLVNAFNFPAWGLWEKAGPALLSGMPILVKPATPTALLAHAMIRDIVDAGVLPAGAMSVVCGRSDGLLDALQPFDVLSFTGSAATAAVLRGHPAIASRSVRANIESDSINAALLMPSASGTAGGFALFVREIVREMTGKSGQKCTAIRRAFVPRGLYDRAAQALCSALAAIKVGNPRNAEVTMGSLVSREQRRDVERGISALRAETDTLVEGTRTALVDVPSDDAAVLAPWLFGVRGEAPPIVHTTEVFGPVSTLIAYDDLDHACDLIRRGEGSLVCSIYGDDAVENASAALRLAPYHGRVHVVSPAVAATHTGHGNVMPLSVHGGPGRAGGGSELGGLRALEFFHHRCAVQAETGSLGTYARAAEWAY